MGDLTKQERDALRDYAESHTYCKDTAGTLVVHTPQSHIEMLCDTADSLEARIATLTKERDDAVAALGEIRKEVGRAMPMCYECMRAQEILSRWEATNEARNHRL